MGLHKWISIIKEKCKNKQIEKLKENFAFLENNENNNTYEICQEIRKLYTFIDECTLSLKKELLGTKEELNSLNNLVKNIQIDIQETNLDLSNRTERINTLINGLSGIVEKNNMLLANNLNKFSCEVRQYINESEKNVECYFSKIYNKSENIEECLTNIPSEFKSSNDSIKTLLEQVDNYANIRASKIEKSMHENLSTVMSDVDDVKNLLRLLAVNELLDEINIS